MSGIRLDDFLSKKKEVAQVLDLSKSVARTKEDLKKLLDKVPEFKSKAEKIRADDIKIRDKDWTFKPTKKELRYVADFTFANPVPADMRPVKLEDLISVPIDWRMLTTLRPKTKLDEEFFSRLIELGKLTRSTLQYERQREGPRSTYAATSSSWVKRFKSRSGVVETKATTCSQCGDEFCDGTACKLFTYDCFKNSITGTCP
ncbi:uncharacterized protein LOC117643864 [Thrips palmi]|uniref:Uncharacterized protein LOC117643864 n=1 Tax=Thrips palmi TaxID=161013 RepID=A0A6P8YPQ2_THRPL|nr:uncharacterized protein LOC117643864 [Thrips palmi]